MSARQVYEIWRGLQPDRTLLSWSAMKPDARLWWRAKTPKFKAAPGVAVEV